MTGAVNAVTGAVNAVTWGRDPALDVTGTVPAVIAVAGCHSPSRRADRPGHVLPHWGRLFTQRSLARPKLRPLCATRVATLAPVDTLSVASLVTCLARPRGLQNVPRPKRPRCRAIPRRHRRQPWRQPGDWLINLPIASTALLRSEPDQGGGNADERAPLPPPRPTTDAHVEGESPRPSIEHGARRAEARSRRRFAGLDCRK